MPNCLDRGTGQEPGEDSEEPYIENPPAEAPATVRQVLAEVARDPIGLFIHRWNWKAALFSSLFRGTLFFFANLSAGLAAATGALGAEFAYRALTAGLYGSLMQSFRRAEPRWAATAMVMLGVPAISHGIEFLVHWQRGTPNLKTSIIASFCFTILTTLYNLHAMRRGVLVVGRGGKPFRHDLRSIPAVTTSFVLTGFGLLRDSPAVADEPF